MIAMTFKDFFQQNYDVGEGNQDLYMFKHGDQLMYIGITSASIWERWFEQADAHFIQDRRGMWCGNSQTGKYIMKHLADAENFIIEFWTDEDCMKQLELSEHDQRFRLFGIRDYWVLDLIVWKMSLLMRIILCLN